MKRLLLFILLAAATAPAFSQANSYWYGRKKAKLTQYEITENESYMFPTWDAQNPNTDDTVTVTITQYETYITHDTITGTSVIALAPTSAVLAGAKVYLKPLSDSADVSRTLKVNQGTTPIDTVTVSNTTIFRTYVYNGTLFKPVYK